MQVRSHVGVEGLRLYSMAVQRRLPDVRIALNLRGRMRSCRCT